MNLKTIALISLVLMLTCISPVLGAIPSSGEYHGLWYPGEVIRWHTPAEICAYAGLGAPTYSNIYFPVFYWATGNVLVSQDNWATQPNTNWTIPNNYFAPTYYIQEMEVCSGGTGYYWYINITPGTRPPVPPTADYSCNFNPIYPYYQAPFDLECVDNSTGDPPTSQSWTLTQPDTSIYNTSLATLTKTLTNIGWYQLDYAVCNGAGCDYKNETQFFNLSATAPPPPTGITTYLTAKNAITGYYIQDVTFGLKNTTSGIWKYGLAPTGTSYADSTAGTESLYQYPLTVGQEVESYAAATGYNSLNTTFTIPYDGWVQYMLLTPNSVINATGTGTVVATVIRNKDGTPVGQASVTLDTGQMAITNGAGAATFMNVTAGNREATVTNVGYQGFEDTSKTFVLSAGETKMVIIELLGTGETPHPTYAPPTSTGDVLVDTDGDGIPDTPSSLVGNYTAGQLNQRGSSGLMEMMGSLIEFWPLIFLLAFLKFMKEALN